MPTDLIFHEIFTKHVMTPGHPERPERLITSMDYITKAGLLESKVNLIEPEKADIDAIVPLHSPEYLELVKAKSERGGGYFTMDTVVNKFTYEAAMTAAGGSILAVDRVLDKLSNNAYVMCRPPGHHAEYNRAFGFCFINNVAVAANHLVQNRGMNRILILDYDAHHGNGTQNAFYSSSQVLYVGMHQDGRTLFPGSGFPNEIGSGEGLGYNVNFSMYPGAGDKSYILAFDEVIDPICAVFKPEFVLVSAGYDGHFEDPLTSLGLTTAGFAMINTRLHSIAKEYSEGRMAVFLEGGYSLDIVAKGSQNLLEELSGSAISNFGDSHTESQNCTEHNMAVMDFLKENLENVFF